MKTPKNYRKIPQANYFLLNQRNNGFTLIELLVTVAVLGILAALLLPMANRSIDQAKYTKCVSHLRQWGTGFQLFTTDNDGRLPTSYEDGATKNGWQEKIAPYLVGNSGVVDQQRFLMRTKFECPGNTKAGGIVYGANNYLRPQQYPQYYPRTTAALPEKRSDFLLLAENYEGELWNTLSGTAPAQKDKVDYFRHKVGKNKVANLLFADFHIEGMTSQQTMDRPVVMIPPR